MHFYTEKGVMLDTNTNFPTLSQSDAIKKCLELGLVPSVTTIFSIVNLPHINTWAKKQCLEQFIKTNDKQLALEYQNTIASEKGTELHDFLEQFLLNDMVVPTSATDDQLKYTAPFINWARANIKKVLFTEKSFTDKDLGYAGTADLGFISKSDEIILGDFKFKKHSKRYPIKSSMEYACQLSAYEAHYSKTYGPMKKMNFIMNSGLGYEKQSFMKIFEYTKDYSYQMKKYYDLWMLINTGTFEQDMITTEINQSGKDINQKSKYKLFK